ncbi:MAG: hypothetical protein ACE5J5_04735 [Candidatus Hydrothermarchaeales archaeon]
MDHEEIDLFFSVDIVIIPSGKDLPSFDVIPRVICKVIFRKDQKQGVVKKVDENCQYRSKNYY